MSVIAFIFARGGSKGLPRKNLRPLGGKPLLAWAIDCARACPQVDRVIVSTDDEEIAATARAFGAEVPFLRPAELAQDQSPEWLAWRHAVKYVQEHSGPFDVFLAVPVTSPLRAPEDLTACIQTLQGGDCDGVVTMTPSARNPYFNMVRQDETGKIAVALDAGYVISRRQDAPEMFDLTTVAYAVRPDFILSADDLFPGAVKAVVVPKERALDIDDAMDLAFAEFLVARGQTP
ncbi:MAG: acylneuraminate cytidylyltransferase family protein [Rhodospirillaceae bacterium]|nr:acylneuraminate cytidylyltransferase family protein [Rhodospirillales bacterium]